MKCFYHKVDLDGQCSAAIVKHFNPECELMGITYGDKFPIESIGKNEIVYMVDFSLQPFSEIVKLNKICKLYWIDHHKSAIEDYEAYWDAHRNLSIEGIREIGTGACELVWRFLSKLQCPQAVKYLSQYDVWDLIDPNVLKFQYGMRLSDWNPEKQDFWTMLFNGIDVQSRIESGAVILEYVKQDNEKYAKACAFECLLQRYKCIAINRGGGNSQMFASVWDSTKYDMMIAYCFDGKKYNVSLYSDRDDIDCSVVAKMLGGGGHHGAAGFNCETLPFKTV